MVSSTETGGRSDLVASLTAVEFDTDRELFQATYDSTRESASLAVVAVVATVLGRNPVDLPPLHTAIDSEALDQLVVRSIGVHGCDCVSFEYEGVAVTLTSEGQIEADPVENTTVDIAEQNEPADASRDE